MRIALAVLLATSVGGGRLAGQAPAKLPETRSDSTAKAPQEIDQRPTLDSVQAWYFPKGHLHSKATVVFEAVVDTTGRVEPETITLVRTTDSVFVAAARLTFMVAYYQPGRIHGQPVRVRVQQGLTYKPGVGRRCQLPNITPLLPPKC